jgi:hypothetical protein
MVNPEIAQIDGVWTSSQVQDLKTWLHSSAGLSELKANQEKLRQESKIIEKMAIVDVNELKTPFTFSI